MNTKENLNYLPVSEGCSTAFVVVQPNNEIQNEILNKKNL